jgi:hypothetical protein
MLGRNEDQFQVDDSNMKSHHSDYHVRLLSALSLYTSNSIIMIKTDTEYRHAVLIRLLLVISKEALC